MDKRSALMVMLLLFACKQQGRAPQAHAKATADNSIRHIAEYAEGYRLLVEKPATLVSEYARVIPSEGPEAKRRTIQLFPHDQLAQRQIVRAEAAFARAKKGAPARLAELGPQSDAALAATKQVHAIYGEARTYYAADDYKDDAFAKGKEIHARMQAVGPQLVAALDAMATELMAVQNAHALAELQKYASEKSYGYWFRQYNLHAKTLVATVDRKNPAAFAAQLVTVKQGLEQLNGFARQKGDQLHPTFNAYVHSSDRFHARADKLLRAMSDGEQQDQERQAKLLAQRYENLIDVSQALLSIEASGRLR